MPRVGMVRRSSRVLAGCVMAVLVASLTGAVGVRTAKAASGWFNQNVTAPSPNFLVTAYDTTHHVVLGFDGTQTWTWTTSTRTWTAVPTAHVPTGTGFFAITFDSSRGKAVMITSPFIQSSHPTELVTTWEFAGTDWTQLSPAHSPPARFGRSRSVAFDSRRGVTVLFSGQFADAGGPGDTWEWNGTDWTDRSTIPAPFRRDGHCLAYDSARGVMLMFGGETLTGSGGGLNSDTWEYDGTQWTNLGFAGIGPGSFAACNMVYDPVIGRMIDFTPKFAPDNLSFVLEPFYWSGSNWVDSNFPGPMGGAAPAAYDVASDTVLIDLAPVPAGSPQTWLLNPPPPPTPGWVNQNVTATSPVVMTYDSARHVILALDGSKTWNYSTTSRTWTAIPTVNHPSAGGVNFAMTFDSARGKAVVVASPTPLGDPVTNLITTWEWDGTNWTQILSAHTPPARSGFEQSLAYDAKRGVTVLFSGQFNGVPGDTWEWNGTDWTDRTTSTGPIGRQNQCLGYDTKRNVTVLYGGFEALGSGAVTLTDTWEYDGTSWTQKASSGGPSSFDCSLTYDPVVSRMIGLANKSVPPTSQALEPYYWDGASWVDTLLPGPAEDGFTAAYDPGSDAVVVDLFPLTTGGPETWLFNPPPPGGGGGGTAPVVTAVSPNHGPAAGMTQVKISGTGFTGATGVNFRSGQTPLQLCGQQPIGVHWCFLVDTDTQITAFSPPLPLGSGDLFVITPNGLSANAPGDLYFAEGWDRPTPDDKTAFDVPITAPPLPPNSQKFTLKLLEAGIAQIGHGMLPDFVTCTDTTNPATAAGTEAQVDCSVSPTGSGLVPITFFDANDLHRVPTRTYIVGRGVYAALGDSFSAGDGNEPYDNGTGDAPGDGCHRSPVSYGRLIAFDLYGGSVKHVACAGAIIKNVYFGQDGEARQLDALSEQVDLVTISIGGNDMGFGDIGKACFVGLITIHCEFLWDGPAHDALRRIGAPGSADQPSDGNTPDHDPIFTLERTYAAIRAKAPNARIVVVGYPRILPKFDPLPCFTITLDEQLWANHLTGDLNDTVRTSAARAGVEFVDVQEAFDGHELCSPDIVHTDVTYPVPGGPTPIHPNSRGQGHLRDFVEAAVKAGPPGSSFLVQTNQKTITVAGVNPGSGSVSFQTSWPGSDIVTTLVSPSGRTIDRNTTASDVIDNRGPNYEVITVNNPEAGQWTVSMFGANVSPDGEDARLNVVQLAAVDQPPHAVMTATPAAGTAPLSVAFDASGSSDPDGTVASYAWDFGDGTSGTGATATHVYSAPGRYAATLTVTDNAGRQGFAGTVLTVRGGTHLVYTGPAGSDFNDPAMLSATLTSAITGNPVPGITVTFTAGGQTCSALTDAAGHAACSITPSAAAGAGQVVVTSPESDRFAAAATRAAFTVTPEETRLARPRSAEVQGPEGDFQGAQTSSLMLSTVLTTDGVPLPGKTVTFTIGRGTNLLTCQAVTSASGAAACAVTPPEDFDPHHLVVSFAGDAYYAASSAQARGDEGGDREGERGRGDSR